MKGVFFYKWFPGKVHILVWDVNYYSERPPQTSHIHQSVSSDTSLHILFDYILKMAWPPHQRQGLIFYTDGSARQPQQKNYTTLFCKALILKPNTHKLVSRRRKNILQVLRLIEISIFFVFINLKHYTQHRIYRTVKMQEEEKMSQIHSLICGRQICPDLKLFGIKIQLVIYMWIL